MLDISLQSLKKSMLLCLASARNGVTPWRRPQGRVCATCDGVIRTNPHFIEQAGGSQDALVAALSDESAKLFLTWMVAVQKHEDARSIGKYVRSVGGLHSKAFEESAMVFRKKVQRYQG